MFELHLLQLRRRLCGDKLKFSSFALKICVKKTQSPAAAPEKTVGKLRRFCTQIHLIKYSAVIRKETLAVTAIHKFPSASLSAQFISART